MNRFLRNKHVLAGVKPKRAFRRSYPSYHPLSAISNISPSPRVLESALSYVQKDVSDANCPPDRRSADRRRISTVTTVLTSCPLRTREQKKGIIGKHEARERHLASG